MSSADDSYELLGAFVNTVETACLLHDIGNPPFGHLGESAIQEWFDNFKLDTPADLNHFDGNPQGFRQTSFLCGSDKFGFNLTCTLLLSTIKYPWTLSQRPDDSRKYGIFVDDYRYYTNACGSVDWSPGKRFPYARLMDTADDIAYSISDLEDGLEKNIITIDDLAAEFGSNYFKEGAISPIVQFKTNVINNAVEHAAKTFSDRIDGVLEGEDFRLIDKGSEVGDLIDKINGFARERIYAHEDAEKIELAGRSVIKGLLGHFGELIAISEEGFDALVRGDSKIIKNLKLDFQGRLFRRLPQSYVNHYKEGKDERGSELERRSHLIVDFVAGMTDDFALETYQVLEGIRIK